MTVLLAVLTIAAFLTAEYALEARRKRQASASALFHRGHTWALPVARGFARVGIDDFARQVVGTIDRIEFPEPGKEVRQGDALFAVVRGRRKIDFVSPLDGRVVSVRHDAARAAVPGDDPYRKGYFLTLDPTDMARNAPELRTAAEAPRWIERELARLYEFAGLHMARPLEVGATMRDGGAYAAGIVEKFEEPLFGEFVRNFLR
jgi:glycine cleavage system H lipoate-binding protein